MSLFSSIAVSASGMAAQRTRAELLVENMANSETTHTAEGGPYRRKDAIFETQQVTSPFSTALETAMGDGTASGVAVTDVSVDQTTPDKRYMPGHPDADVDGYVSFPKFNPAEDMVDLMEASRNYEGNVSAISAVKDMIQKSIDLLTV